ncbi:PREDICTED: dehydrogenase/reductase SDR family member 2, mitochondrial-like [Myotis davidii]|uniref:dehydrogenase/reductase SDR family member 2, mitochondrial-like n=1 Tax=Myotis davidii TaxID=225400 RepID=UPI0007670FC4|nr:PREDICTED: dehydrogenase/reductase SDR family member 2, mitochondrial-like [Myotis davidii]
MYGEKCKGDSQKTTVIFLVWGWGGTQPAQVKSASDLLKFLFSTRKIWRQFLNHTVELNLSHDQPPRRRVGRDEAVIAISALRIGFAISRHLAQDGAHVVVSSRKQQNVDQALAVLQGEGLSMSGTMCHVGKAEDRDQLVATALRHSGNVDFLVCVAGVNPYVGSTLGSSEEVWDKILNVNVKAPALLLSQLLPHMENRGGSSVVLVSSIGAYLPEARLGAYNVSKAAILGLTKTLSLELAPKDIRVNCLVPGVIDTAFSKVTFEDPDFWNHLKGCHGIQRVGQPEDCSGLVSFLCSPDASYITGESIAVAGFSPHL